jgi:hypothetical protein
MESNGEALKIHMSHSTKQVLDRFGTFEMTMRGFVSVKGKGEMLCFWLDGEKPSATPINNSFEKPHQEIRAILPSEAANPEEKMTTKAIAIVPPLTPQNSFSSKKSVSICAATNGNGDIRIENDQLFGSKKSSIFGKKKQLNLSNEKLQPLLSTVK